MTDHQREQAAFEAGRYASMDESNAKHLHWRFDAAFAARRSGEYGRDLKLLQAETAEAFAAYQQRQVAGKE